MKLSDGLLKKMVHGDGQRMEIYDMARELLELRENYYKLSNAEIDRDYYKRKSELYMERFAAAELVIKAFDMEPIYQWVGWRDSEIKKALEAYDKVVKGC